MTISNDGKLPYEITVLIYWLSQKLFIAKKQREIELMLEKAFF